ncbi:MAG: efflux transporter outer membrane subunit [Gemmatimonadales bacterium]
MRSTLLLGFLALHGSAVTPTSVIAFPAPHRETIDSAHAVPVAVDYWRELGDTTLTRLVNEALGANRDVRAAEARVRQARASRTGAVLDLAPTVTVAGGYTRRRLSSATFPVGSGTFPDQDIWDGGFDASWEIDLFGRLRRSLQAEGAFVAGAQEDLRNVQVSLAAELARAYFELRGSQEQLLVIERNAANQSKTLELTRQRLEAGRGTAFDTERAQAQLSFTRAAIPGLQTRVAAAQYRIGVLLGRSPSAVDSALRAPAELPALPPPLAVTPPDSIVEGRPDVVAAERRLAAAGALVGSAKADYLPRLTVGGSAGYSAARLRGLGDAGTFRYAVGPVLSWPALNLGRVKARVDQSKAQQSEARAVYDQTVLLAEEEIETALIRYRTSLDAVAQIDEAAQSSERAAELARLRFTEGVADFLQVLDAERTQLDAQAQLAQARTDAATAYAALFKALGGRWPG